MKVEYVHISAPETVKNFDTIEAFKKRTAFDHNNQNDFDNQILLNFKKNKSEGLILYYKVIE